MSSVTTCAFIRCCRGRRARNRGSFPDILDESRALPRRFLRSPLPVAENMAHRERVTIIHQFPQRSSASSLVIFALRFQLAVTITIAFTMSATIVATVVIVDALYDKEAMYHGRPCIRILPREREREREKEKKRLETFIEMISRPVSSARNINGHLLRYAQHYSSSPSLLSSSSSCHNVIVSLISSSVVTHAAITNSGSR